MVRRTDRPLQARAAATREAIVQAAATVFAERGYAGASIDQILAQAEVTKGALYFHFESKAELASAVITALGDTWTQLRARVEEEGDRQGWSHLERLHRVALGVAQEYVRSIVMTASMRLGDESNTIGIELPVPMRGWMGYLDGMLQRAQDAGEMPAAADRATIARIVIASIYGLERLSRRPGQRREEFPDRVEEWWALVLPGLTGVSPN